MPNDIHETLDKDHRRFRLIHDASDCFGRLVKAVDDICLQYEKEKPHAWAMSAAHADSDWLRRVLMDMWHEPGISGVVTSKHSGVIAASPVLRKRFNALNEQKQAFKAIADEIKQTKPVYTSQSQLKEEIGTQYQHLRQHLNTAGLARLSLKKTVRTVYVLEHPIRHIGIGWQTSGRSIVKISMAEAEKRLIKFGADKPHIEIQLKKLASLPPNEPLALVHKQSPQLRANVHFAEIDDAPPPRSLAFNSSLPIIVAPDPRTGLLPSLRTPPSEPANHQRERRKDAKVDVEPFLPSINVHRYLSDRSTPTV